VTRKPVGRPEKGDESDDAGGGEETHGGLVIGIGTVLRFGDLSGLGDDGGDETGSLGHWICVATWSPPICIPFQTDDE